MSCPCCAPLSCTGRVTFVVTDFTSVSKTTGRPAFPQTDPNGTYSGLLTSGARCEVFASGGAFCTAFGSQVIAVQLEGNFVRPAFGTCSSVGGVACGVVFIVHGPPDPTNPLPCWTLYLNPKVSQSQITIQQLSDGITLTQDDFSVLSPDNNFLAFFTLAFNIFIQRNPLA